ncbi:hypothetical protein [Azospirillum sp. B510]|uniref:hypothetical protein n=1 Tax=Azospirillum sp. (strain B510) TaxID=137722 RepID=UPI0005A76D22|nr:hypothetical protein [Azospirillum sp. B510]
MIGIVQLLGGAAGSLIAPSIGVPVEQAVPAAMVVCAGIAVLASVLLKPRCTALEQEGPAGAGPEGGRAGIGAAGIVTGTVPLAASVAVTKPG